MTLQEFFAENPRAAIAFSGGVDSSYLLYAAVQCGADVHAYFAKTAFQPQFELDDAQRLAESVGAKLTVLELDALSSEDVARNPANRCYYCKQNIFGNLKRAAAEDGFTLILDGTNASDDAGDRPGMRALREMDVRSPLRECGLTKAEIRRLSHKAGLFTQGYTDFRVRLLDGCARLQFPADQLSRALAQHDEIVAALKPDYRAVLLDLEARHA